MDMGLRLWLMGFSTLLSESPSPYIYIYIYIYQTMGLVKTLLSEAHAQVHLINRLGPSHGPY